MFTELAYDERTESDMKARNKIKKAGMPEFFHQCRIHRGEEEFRQLVLEGYHNPDYLKIESRGNEYPGQIVYQIGAFGCSAGFFAEFLYTLIRLYFAADRGFTPYVNWGSDFCIMNRMGLIMKKMPFYTISIPLLMWSVPKMLPMFLWLRTIIFTTFRIG